MLALYFNLLLFVFKRIVEIFVLSVLLPESRALARFSVRFVLSLSLVVQFSRTIAAALVATFILYHIFAALSSGFAKVFWKNLLADFYQLVSLCDLYIISYSGSFVKRFCRSFLKSFSLAGALCALSLTALLLYHIPSRLSTPFWKFSSIRH